VLVRGEDNAATELVEEGRSGFVASSSGADDLATALIRVHQAGAQLRKSTLACFNETAQRRSLAESLEKISTSYRR
jgi:hypothetical protein